MIISLEVDIARWCGHVCLCVCLAVDSTLVECPVCTSKVKASLINAHLDRCLNDPGQSISPPTPPLSSQPLLSSRTENRAVPPKMSGMPLQYQRSKPLPRLPKIVFNIMNDRTLKKKLKEYHLSTHGSRKTLISRLEEFTLQYKAQQDTLCPKTGKGLRQPHLYVVEGRVGFYYFVADVLCPDME